MAIPTYDQVMLLLLKFIQDGNIYNNQQCIEGLASYFNLTEEELNQRLSSNKKVFYDRVNWAKTYLGKAQLIESPSRGKFKITLKGSELLKEDIQEIDAKFLQRYDSFNVYFNKGKTIHQHKREDVKSEMIQDRTPLENLENAVKELKESLAEELLEKVKEVDFFYFEEIVLDLLVKMGYGGSRETAKNATKKTGDEGIDGIINEDRLGLDRIYHNLFIYKRSYTIRRAT